MESWIICLLHQAFVYLCVSPVNFVIKSFFVLPSLCTYRLDCVEHNHILTELLCITPKDTLKHRVLLHFINLLHLQGKVKTKQLIALYLKINYMLTTGQNVKSLKLPLIQTFCCVKKIQKSSGSLSWSDTDWLSHSTITSFFCKRENDRQWCLNSSLKVYYTEPGTDCRFINRTEEKEMLFKHLTSVSFLFCWIDPTNNIHGLAVAMVSLHSSAVVIGCWGNCDRQGRAWMGSSLWPLHLYLFILGGLWINNHAKYS